MFYKYYDELTWEEVEKLDKEKCCVLLPLSSIEQHGKHLPVGTDDYILRMCMEQLEEKENPSDITFLCLPIFGIGTSDEHMTFPGTISFSATTYFAIINDIVTALAKHGFKINSGVQQYFDAGGDLSDIAVCNNASQVLKCIHIGLPPYAALMPNTCQSRASSTVRYKSFFSLLRR